MDSNNNPTDCSLNGDGVVSCTPDNQSASIFWFDSSPPDGGSDCDDNDVTRYPTAAEICDGRFNDCINPLLDPFEGVTGDDCYCTDFTSGDCIDSNGDTCNPDAVGNLTTAMTIDGTDYTEQAIGCYCLDTDCKIDVDGDGVSDCLDLDGALCVPTDEDDDNYADACLTDDNEITDAILIDF